MTATNLSPLKTPRTLRSEGLASFTFPADHNALRPFELAAKLDCSMEHILNLIEEGKIKALNIAGANNKSARSSLRVSRESWEAFLLENTH